MFVCVLVHGCARHVSAWLSSGLVRVGFSEGQYQVREDVGKMMVPVQLDGGDSQVSLSVFTVDGTAYGNTPNQGQFEYYHL